MKKRLDLDDVLALNEAEEQHFKMIRKCGLLNAEEEAEERDLDVLFGKNDDRVLSPEEQKIVYNFDISMSERVKQVKALRTRMTRKARTFEQWTTSTDHLHAHGMGIRLD